MVEKIEMYVTRNGKVCNSMEEAERDEAGSSQESILDELKSILNNNRRLTYPDQFRIIMEITNEHDDFIRINKIFNRVIDERKGSLKLITDEEKARGIKLAKNAQIFSQTIGRYIEIEKRVAADIWVKEDGGVNWILFEDGVLAIG